MTDSAPSPVGEEAGEPLTSDRVLTELASVQVAHEELRVAEEELRVQQEQITHLLVQHDAAGRWRGQMSALVPVGLCVTDGTGTVLEANPALATHLGVGPHRLRGKPLSVFIAPDDVHAFRDALGDLGPGTTAELRLSIEVRPRNGTQLRTHLFGFTETPSHRPSFARVQWILVPEELGQLPRPSLAQTPETDATPSAQDEQPEEPISSADVIGLATSLAELAALPVGDLDRQRLLHRMATLVRGAVPGADWVSIAVGSPLQPQRLSSDSVEAQTFDGLQVQAGQGPCLDAFRAGTVVSTPDVTADARWPELARLARSAAVRSVLALPVQEDGVTTGAVNVFSREPGRFGASGRRIGELATAAVASVLQTVTERESVQRLAENLEKALSSRAVIDQAKGMVMALLGVDAEEAFAKIVNLSSRLNVKVRDLAALIVEGHIDTVLQADAERSSRSRRNVSPRSDP